MWTLNGLWNASERSERGLQAHTNQRFITLSIGEALMCMRCGKRRSPRRGEDGCTCHQELAACKTSGKHGMSVTERKDRIFPDYIHIICNACGHECGTK